MLIFFFNDTATTEIYTLSLHDALPIFLSKLISFSFFSISVRVSFWSIVSSEASSISIDLSYSRRRDRKSTRLNSSHSQISYAVFCLKKKKKKKNTMRTMQKSKEQSRAL